jgi:hypothetical protein
MYQELLIFGATISTSAIVLGAYLSIYHPATKHLRVLLAIGSVIQWISVVGLYYTEIKDKVEDFVTIDPSKQVITRRKPRRQRPRPIERRRSAETNYNEVTPEQIIAGTVWTENPEENPGTGWIL